MKWKAAIHSDFRESGPNSDPHRVNHSGGYVDDTRNVGQELDGTVHELDGRHVATKGRSDSGHGARQGLLLSVQDGEPV
jgi:hypothetical protein